MNDNWSFNLFSLFLFVCFTVIRKTKTIDPIYKNRVLDLEKCALISQTEPLVYAAVFYVRPPPTTRTSPSPTTEKSGSNSTGNSDGGTILHASNVYSISPHPQIIVDHPQWTAQPFDNPTTSIMDCFVFALTRLAKILGKDFRHNSQTLFHKILKYAVSQFLS